MRSSRVKELRAAFVAGRFRLRSRKVTFYGSSLSGDGFRRMKKEYVRRQLKLVKIVSRERAA